MDEQVPSLNLIERPSSYFKDDLKLFLKTDDSVLKNMFCNLDLNWTKDKDEEIKKLSKKLTMVEGDANRIFNMGGYIFSKLKKGEITFDDINEDFKRLEFDKAAFNKIKEAYETYGKEFADKNNLRTAYRERLYEGSNKLHSVISKLNYRVIHDDSKKVLDLVPVVEISLSVMPFKYDQTNNKEQITTFEVTEDDLNRIIESFDNLKTEFLIASEYLKGLKGKK